jgi:hypothetical protein
MSQCAVVDLRPTSHVDAQPAPAIVGQNVTLGALDYLRRLNELGALEGALGNQGVSQELVPVVEALHHLLAGGLVELRIQSPGNAKVLAELEELFRRALQEANAVNRAAGYQAVPLTV